MGRIIQAFRVGQRSVGAQHGQGHELMTLLFSVVGYHSIKISPFVVNLFFAFIVGGS